jgi:hypothetical protein
MPQNPNQVLVGLNSGQPKSLATDSTGHLLNGGTPVSATVATGTIGATGTFQACLAAKAARVPGGAITNNGNSVMQVFVGAIADATAAKAIDLAGGQTLFLSNVFGATQVYTGAIAITGTKDETFATLELTRASS